MLFQLRVGKARNVICCLIEYCILHYLCVFWWERERERDHVMFYFVFYYFDFQSNISMIFFFQSKYKYDFFFVILYLSSYMKNHLPCKDHDDSSLQITWKIFKKMPLIQMLLHFLPQYTNVVSTSPATKYFVYFFYLIWNGRQF
jgi:hypothetical protein